MDFNPLRWLWDFITGKLAEKFTELGTQAFKLVADAITYLSNQIAESFHNAGFFRTNTFRCSSNNDNSHSILWNKDDMEDNTILSLTSFFKGCRLWV